MPENKQTGFTLVELLVVIAIVAVLASLLMPALLKGRQRANMVNCASNLKQIAIAYQMYAEDHFENFPTSASGGLFLANASDEIKTVYPDYLNTSKVFWCPADSDEEPDGKTPLGDGSGGTVAYDISYRYVFGLTTANDSVVPIPMVSDRCLLDATPNPDVFRSNHNQGANTLYIDGSVRWAIYAEPAYFSTLAVWPGPGKVACDINANSITIDATAVDSWGQN